MISYDMWMHLTYRSTKIRSSALKKVDAALKQYEQTGNPNDRVALEQAFAAWAEQKRRSHGNRGYDSLDASISVRNGKARVVDLLETQLFGSQESMGKQELDARQAIVDSQLARMNELFKGSKLVLKGTMAKINLGKGLATGSYGVISKSRSFVDATKRLSGTAKVTTTAVHSGSSLSKGLVQGIFEGAKLQLTGHLNDAIRMVEAIAGPSLTEFGKSLVPYFGFISTGTKMVTQWGQAIGKTYKAEETRWHKAAFRKGDPLQAFEAYQRLLREAAADAIATASFTTGKFGATAAAMAVPDGGAGVATAVNASLSLAEAMKKLSIICFEVYRVITANQQLAAMTVRGRITPEIFGAHPILGCYYLANASTSDLLNLAVGDWRGDGWMIAAEAIVKKDITPTLDTCRQLMNKSWFTVDVLAKSKGSYATDWVSIKKRGLTKVAKAFATSALNVPDTIKARLAGYETLGDDDLYQGFGRQDIKGS